MELYDVITAFVWAILVFGFGVVFGMLSGSFLSDKARNTIIMITYFVFIMIISDFSVLEVVTDILDMSITELATLAVWPALCIIGSKIGKRYKIVIMKR